MLKIVGMSAKSKAEGLMGTVMDKTGITKKTSTTVAPKMSTKISAESKVTVNGDMAAIPEQRKPGDNNNEDDTIDTGASAGNDELSLDNLLGDDNGGENDEVEDLFNNNHNNDDEDDDQMKTRSDSKKELIVDEGKNGGIV